MENDGLFQDIFDQISTFLPSGWEEVVFYAEYNTGSYSMEFYVVDSSGKITKCFDVPGVNKGDLIEAFMSIDDEIADIRATLKPKELWTTMTMTIGNNGRFKTDYGYEDLSEGALERKRAWKEKYLKGHRE